MLAQELRTPLSLITAPLKEMITNTAFPESFLQKAKMAYRNSISLQSISYVHPIFQRKYFFRVKIKYRRCIYF
jgi:hypothetical protein